MNRKKILKVSVYFLSLLLILLVLLYLLSFQENPDKNNKNIEDPNQLRTAIYGTIEDFSAYEDVAEKENFFGKGCNNEEFNIFIRQAEKGEIKQFILPGGLRLIITPNYYNWDNEKFLSFINAQPEAFCGAGGAFPLRAYENVLLWKQSCSTGYMPSEDELGYDYFMECLHSEEQIKNYFENK